MFTGAQTSTSSTTTSSLFSSSSSSTSSSSQTSFSFSASGPSPDATSGSGAEPSTTESLPQDMPPDLRQLLGSVFGVAGGAGAASVGAPTITVTTTGVPAFIQGVSEFVQQVSGSTLHQQGVHRCSRLHADGGEGLRYSLIPKWIKVTFFLQILPAIPFVL